MEEEKELPPESLQEFLESRNIWKEFLENCKPEKQNWEDGKPLHNGPDDLMKKSPPGNWLSDCFLWDTPDRDADYWSGLSSAWENLTYEYNEKQLLNKITFYKPAVEEIQECTFCDGSGKYHSFMSMKGKDDGNCPVCEGTGTIVYEIPT